MNSTTTERPADTGLRAALAEATLLAGRSGRADIVDDLRDEADHLDVERFQVVVAGEFGRGKSALINALIGVRVCGVSAETATAVPTLVRGGPRVRARGIRADSGGGPAARGNAAADELALGQIPALTLQAASGEAGPYLSIEVELPRELLRTGLILIDTPGLGGGFASAAAAPTLRALSGADALLFVTDASSEVTASEVDFLAEAAQLCPAVLCVVTKTDLYPHWRQTVQRNRELLHGAGLAVGVLAVSSVMRELAIDTADTALAAESGFAILSQTLVDDLRRTQRATRCRSAAAKVDEALRMVGSRMEAERSVVANPADREELLMQLRDAEQRTLQIQGAAAQWHEALADEWDGARRQVQRDRIDRFDVLRANLRQRLAEAEPARDWADLEPWLVRSTNEAVMEHHHVLLDRLAGVSRAVSRSFGSEVDELPIHLAPMPSELDQPMTLAKPTAQLSRVDVALVSVRGFTLTGSVMGGLVEATNLALARVPGFSLASFGGPVSAIAALVALTAGSMFAGRSVSTMRQSHLKTLRSELERSVAAYLDHVLTATSRYDEDTLFEARRGLRTYFADESNRLVESAGSALAAASTAAHLDPVPADRRRVELEVQLSAVEQLRRAVALTLSGAIPPVSDLRSTETARTRA